MTWDVEVAIHCPIYDMILLWY